MAACAYETAAHTTANDQPPIVETPIVYNTHPNEEPALHSTSAFEDFHMYIPAGSVTPTSVRLSMINEGSQHISHGVMFQIEQYQNGSWNQPPLIINDVFWILPLLNVPSNTTIDENINWEWKHGPLPPGTYRVVRHFNAGHNPQNHHHGYLYALFQIKDDWKETHDQWQSEQNTHANIAFERFENLNITITNQNNYGLDFTLTNNNPHYAYYIHTIFIGFEDRNPDGAHSAGLVYSIFHSWEAETPKHLAQNETLSMTINWYNEIGNIMETHRWQPTNPYQWQLVIDVQLDVDEAYINKHFRQNIPNVPNQNHRIYKDFEITPN